MVSKDDVPFPIDKINKGGPNKVPTKRFPKKGNPKRVQKPQQNDQPPRKGAQSTEEDLGRISLSSYSFVRRRHSMSHPLLSLKGPDLTDGIYIEYLCWRFLYTNAIHEFHGGLAVWGPMFHTVVTCPKEVPFVGSFVGCSWNCCRLMSILFGGLLYSLKTSLYHITHVTVDPYSFR